jgi:hypothetical protein
MLLVAIIVSPCLSQSVESHISNTTLVFSCPNSVRFVWEERPEGPMEHAKRMHYWSLPRDDRPTAQAEKQGVAQQSVKRADRATKKGKKRKKRKRK